MLSALQSHASPKSVGNMSENLQQRRPAKPLCTGKARPGDVVAPAPETMVLRRRSAHLRGGRPSWCESKRPRSVAKRADRARRWNLAGSRAGSAPNFETDQARACADARPAMGWRHADAGRRRMSETP